MELYVCFATQPHNPLDLIDRVLVQNGSFSEVGPSCDIKTYQIRLRNIRGNR